MTVGNPICIVGLVSKTDRKQVIDLKVGDLVYKGQGSTLWRVMWTDGTLVQVCKASTPVDPAYAIVQRVDQFMIPIGEVTIETAKQDRPKRQTLAERRAAQAQATTEAYYTRFPHLR